MGLASVTLQTLQELVIHSFTYSFTYFSIANYISGIGLVAGNITHRNMTQTSEFTVQLSKDSLDVDETESGMQPSVLIILE